MVATHGYVQSNISLNIPKSREDWITWKIEFLAYAGANRFDKILAGKYEKLPALTTIMTKSGEPVGPTHSFWQYHQKYENDRDVAVQRAWNAILVITKAEHRHIINPFLTEIEVDERVVACWVAICDHMEQKGVTLAKSAAMTKFNQLGMPNTGEFMKDVITFKNEINRLKQLFIDMGIPMHDELYKNKFQLGLPDKHRGSQVIDIVLRNTHRVTWVDFSDAIITQLQQIDTLYEAKAAISVKNKVDEKLQHAKGEITAEAKQLAAMRADLRRAKSVKYPGGKGKGVSHQSKGKSLFTGDCYVCGKRGHKAQDCRSRKQQGQEGDSKDPQHKQAAPDKCPICKRTGHTEGTCWYNKKNKREGADRSQSGSSFKRYKHNDDEESKFKGKAFITFKDGSRSLLQPGQFGIPESDDD